MFDDSYSFNMDVSREIKVKPELKDDSVSPSNYSPREKFNKPKLLSEDDMFSCMTSTKNQR